jgi:polyisoprenoid-binding protein YceI
MAVSGEYTPEKNHRYLNVTYSHFGYSNPTVRWRDWTGTLNWNAENPSDSSVTVTIDAESVDSGVDVFDGHLNGDRFFDTANYPEITFVSTNIAVTGADTGKITGDLTIKDVTKPVTLDVKFNKGAFEERSNLYKLGFSGKTTVKRTDFGMDYLAPAVSDEVDILIETEWTMTAPASE